MTPEQKLEKHIQWLKDTIDFLKKEIEMFKKSEHSKYYPTEKLEWQIATLASVLVNLGEAKSEIPWANKGDSDAVCDNKECD